MLYHVGAAVASAAACFAGALWAWVRPDHRAWASLLIFIGIVTGLAVLQGED